MLQPHYFVFFCLQPYPLELVVDESNPRPASLILKSNLPITCQGQDVLPSSSTPIFCWITFSIKSTADIAMIQRPSDDSSSEKPKNLCEYRLNEADLKPDEGFAYDSDRSLDIVAKVTRDTIS